MEFKYDIRIISRDLLDWQEVWGRIKNASLVLQPLRPKEIVEEKGTQLLKIQC